MRTFFLVIFALLATPSLAAGWGAYENARFGYVIDVPPEFDWGEEAQNGDGRVFTSSDGTQTLRVYGGNILEDDFEADARSAMGFATGEGWELSYERVTPSWASWSGERNGMILYARTVAVCEGTQFARFEYEYPKTALKAADAVVNRLVRSFRETETGAGC
jgi:hypothetical protein